MGQVEDERQSQTIWTLVQVLFICRLPKNREALLLCVYIAIIYIATIYAYAN